MNPKLRTIFRLIYSIYFFSAGILLCILLTGCTDKKHNSAPDLQMIDFSQSEFSARYLELCENSHQMKLTAQLLIDLDLAQHYVATYIGSLPEVKVAVVDTGFDEGNQHQMHARITTKPAFTAEQVPAFHNSEVPPVTNLNQDKLGHGVAVVSLINGKGGIGSAPHSTVTMYKAFVEGHGVPIVAIVEGFTTACQAGNDIVNLSMGTDDDEMGFRLLHRSVSTENGYYSTEESFNEFERLGCQIIQASGNSKITEKQRRKMFQTMKSIAPYLRYQHPALLRTESSTRFENLTNFSTEATIRAPGKDVAVVVSKSSPEKSFYRQRVCQGGMALVDGTSFSAPLSVAVLSLVRGIMKLHPQYRNLPKNVILNISQKILIQSTLHGNINALRAVVLASYWLKSSSYYQQLNWSDAVVSSNLRPFCGKKLISCEAKNSSLNCLQNRRAQATLCPSPAPQIVSIAKITFDLKLSEYLLVWLNRLTNEKPTELNKLVAPYEQYLATEIYQRSIRPSEALEYLRLYQKIFSKKTVPGLVDRWKTNDIFAIIDEKNRFDDRTQRFMNSAAKEGWITKSHLEAIFLRYLGKQNLEEKIRYYDQHFKLIPKLLAKTTASIAAIDSLLKRFRDESNRLYLAQLSVAQIRKENESLPEMKDLSDDQLQEVAATALEQKMAAIDLSILEALTNFNTNIEIAGRFAFAQELALKERQQAYPSLTTTILKFLEGYKINHGNTISKSVPWINAMSKGLESSSTMTYITRALSSLPFDQAALAKAIMAIIQKATNPTILTLLTEDIINSKVAVSNLDRKKIGLQLGKKLAVLVNQATSEELSHFTFDVAKTKVDQLQEMVAKKQ